MYPSINNPSEPYYYCPIYILATSLKVVEGSLLYADIPGFPSPSIVTGDDLRPGLLLKTKENCLYIMELTTGFETNLNNNAERKHLKCSKLVSDLRSQYKSVTFVNLSMSSLGICANSCLSFLKMCDSLSIDNQYKRFLISKLSTISIRTDYYIFCCRDKQWNNPDLLCFWHLFFCFVLYTTIVVYIFACIVTQASQLQITL